MKAKPKAKRVRISGKARGKGAALSKKRADAVSKSRVRKNIEKED